MSLVKGLKYTHVFLFSPLGLAATIVLAVEFVRDPRIGRCLYCLAFAINVVTAGLLRSKVGSSANYFLETNALAAIVVGLYGLSALWTHHQRRAVVVLAVMTLALTIPTIQYLKDNPERWRRFSFGAAKSTVLACSTPGKFVLADGEHIDVVLRAGHRPVVNDPLQLRLLAERGTVRLAGVIDAMNRGDVPCMVLAKPIRWHRERVGLDGFWPDAILDVMERHYRLASVEHDRYVYAYANAP